MAIYDENGNLIRQTYSGPTDEMFAVFQGQSELFFPSAVRYADNDNYYPLNYNAYGTYAQSAILDQSSNFRNYFNSDGYNITSGSPAVFWGFNLDSSVNAYTRFRYKCQLTSDNTSGTGTSFRIVRWTGSTWSVAYQTDLFIVPYSVWTDFEFEWTFTVGPNYTYFPVFGAVSNVYERNTMASATRFQF